MRVPQYDCPGSSGIPSWTRSEFVGDSSALDNSSTNEPAAYLSTFDTAAITYDSCLGRSPDSHLIGSPYLTVPPGLFTLSLVAIPPRDYGGQIMGFCTWPLSPFQESVSRLQYHN